ncbi:MAG: AAA family ATPase [Gaiellaceae bacterium]
MIADVNPFIYSHPVAPEEIIDRDGETRELLTAAVGGHYVRLYGPRKYGKTSLLRRVLLEGERGEGLIPVLVDLYGVLSVADVAIRFERAYAKQLKGKVRSRIEEFLQSTGLGLSLGALGISARLQLEPRTDPLPALHALLDLPLRLEETGGFRALIVLDEFQDITKVREMDALIRSHIQFQGDVASFVFAGSEPGLMRELFENGDRPLYGQAVPMRLGRLADADIAEYIVARFRETGRSAGEAVNPLVASARGHPQRAMLLAHRLWAVVSEGGSATLGDWGTAHMAALAELQPEFDAHWRRLSTSAQRALRAVVGGEGSPFQQRVLEQLDLRKSTARAALQALVGNATVEQEAELYVLVDPLFAEWIANLRESGGDDLSA